MSVNKNNITRSISKSSLLSHQESSDLLEFFLKLIKEKSKLNTIKLSSFGTFSFKKTPKRLGRNPKTYDSYIIPELNKLNFKPSNKIKDKIN
jgi:integration host factor subunit alpha